jgi:hypothetical protein
MRLSEPVLAQMSSPHHFSGLHVSRPCPLTEDVIDHIVHACAEGSPKAARSTLLACALVSHAWLHPARQILHKTLAVGQLDRAGESRALPPPDVAAAILPHVARLVLGLQTGAELVEASTTLYETLKNITPHTTGVLTALWLVAPARLTEWTPVDALPEPTRVAILPVLARITRLELRMSEFLPVMGAAVQTCLRTFPALDTCRISIEWSRAPARVLVGTLAPGALRLRTLMVDGDDEYAGRILGLAGAPSAPTLRRLEANYSALSIAPLAAFLPTAPVLDTLSLRLAVSMWQPSDTANWPQPCEPDTPLEDAVPRDFMARHALASASLGSLRLQVPWMLASLAGTLLEHAQRRELRVLDMELQFGGTAVQDVPGDVFSGTDLARFSALESVEIFLTGIPRTQHDAVTHQEQHIITMLAPFWAKEHPCRLVVMMRLKGSRTIGQWDVDSKMRVWRGPKAKPARDRRKSA